MIKSILQTLELFWNISSETSELISLLKDSEKYQKKNLEKILAYVHEGMTSDYGIFIQGYRENLFKPLKERVLKLMPKVEKLRLNLRTLKLAEEFFKAVGWLGDIDLDLIILPFAYILSILHAHFEGFDYEIYEKKKKLLETIWDGLKRQMNTLNYFLKFRVIPETLGRLLEIKILEVIPSMVSKEPS